MNESPLQLERCFFTEVRVISQADANEEDANRIELVVETEAFNRDEETPRRWIVIVRAKITPKPEAKPGYTADIEAVGMFSVHPSWSEKHIEKLAAINGATIVFGAIRELISNITARGPWDMLILPTYSFVEHYKDKFAETQSKTPVPAIQPAPARTG